VVQEMGADPTLMTQVFKTDMNGRAKIGPLGRGLYVAYVSFNNRQSGR